MGTVEPCTVLAVSLNEEKYSGICRTDYSLFVVHLDIYHHGMTLVTILIFYTLLAAQLLVVYFDYLYSAVPSLLVFHGISYFFPCLLCSQRHEPLSKPSPNFSGSTVFLRFLPSSHIISDHPFLPLSLASMPSRPALLSSTTCSVSMSGLFMTWSLHLASNSCTLAAFLWFSI